MKTWQLKTIFCIQLWLFLAGGLLAQSIGGTIFDERGEPIPFANLYVRELESGTAANLSGAYFLALASGNYQFVFSSVGFESETLSIFVGVEHVDLNVQLLSSATELEQIVVKAGKRDPAFAIIQNAIDHKEENQRSLQSAKYTYYLRALEVLEKTAFGKQKEVERNLKDSLKSAKPSNKTLGRNNSSNKDSEEVDTESIFDNSLAKATEVPKKEEELSGAALVEIDLDLYCQFPKQYKEIRNGYKEYGAARGLFVPNLSQEQSNFYANLVPMTEVIEAPIISPLSRTAILSYKYKLLESKTIDGETVYSIKCIPRKKGASTITGLIQINHEDWSIRSVDFKINRESLKLFDAFTIKQVYATHEDGFRYLENQTFDYKSKKGRKGVFEGQTLVQCRALIPNYEHPADFFGMEMGVTVPEALKRDSTYWKSVRVDSLTETQAAMVFSMDSIKRVHNSDAYKDSTDAAYNEVLFNEVLYGGIGFRDHKKKQQMFIGPIASLVSFDIISGFRVGPFLGYSRRFENQQYFEAWLNTRIGVVQGDFHYTTNGRFIYAPLKLAQVYGTFGKNFEAIFEDDAIRNLILPGNYILHDFAEVGHRFEIFNGFYSDIQFRFSDRSSLIDYEIPSFLDGLVDNQPIYDFNDYQALITEFRFSYTPRQRYLIEPGRKVVLGSKFPTFEVLFRRGWDGVLGSDIEFDYWEAAIKQDVTLGIFGNSKYILTAGKFTNEEDLRLIDLKRFREADPYLLWDPLTGFQVLDTSLVARDLFLEAHLIHHFNGAVMNNIPIVKKTRIRTVVGTSAVWLKEGNYRHAEFYAGITRAIRLGPRRRLRVGLYGVIGRNNVTGNAADWKISFDVIDTWSKSWNF